MSARTHRNDFWGIDRCRERLERSALVVVECCDWFKVKAHRPADSTYSVEPSRLPNASLQLLPEAAATQERRLLAVACTPWFSVGMVATPGQPTPTARLPPTLSA